MSLGNDLSVVSLRSVITECSIPMYTNTLRTEDNNDSTVIDDDRWGSSHCVPAPLTYSSGQSDATTCNRLCKAFSFHTAVVDNHNVALRLSYGMMSHGRTCGAEYEKCMEPYEPNPNPVAITGARMNHQNDRIILEIYVAYLWYVDRCQVGL
jgi:hypothetical protein